MSVFFIISFALIIEYFKFLKVQPRSSHSLTLSSPHKKSNSYHRCQSSCSYKDDFQIYIFSIGFAFDLQDQMFTPNNIFKTKLIIFPTKHVYLVEFLPLTDGIINLVMQVRVLFSLFLSCLLILLTFLHPHH